MHSKNVGSGRNKCLVNTFADLDIYGQSVSFTFQDKVRFPTCIGIFFTVVTLSLMISFTVIRLLKLLNKNDPFFSTTVFDAFNKEVNLGEMNFMFALENIDPKIGRISAQQTKWGYSREERQHLPIEMVDCEELLPGGLYEG